MLSRLVNGSSTNGYMYICICIYIYMYIYTVYISNIHTFTWDLLAYGASRIQFVGGTIQPWNIWNRRCQEDFAIRIQPSNIWGFPLDFTTENMGFHGVQYGSINLIRINSDCTNQNVFFLRFHHLKKRIG